VVIVLAIGPKVCGFKPGKGGGIFKGSRNHSRTYFRGEIKQVDPCHKILWHVKDPYSMGYFVDKIQGHFYQVSPA
jgi:hypothetical protein